MVEVYADKHRVYTNMVEVYADKHRVYTDMVEVYSIMYSTLVPQT